MNPMAAKVYISLDARDSYNEKDGKLIELTRRVRAFNMKQTDRPQSILVVSREPELAEVTRQVTEEAVSVEYAPDEVAGLRQIREKHPDLVVLGHLGPPGAALEYYRKLQEGWISRHASLLVVSLNNPENLHSDSGDKYLAAEIGENSFLSGSSSPLLPSRYILPGLKEMINRKLAQRKNKFRSSILNPDIFCLALEQIPGPGAFEMRQETVLENARKAAQGGKICAISITDNPGGNPAIATDILCAEIRQLGIEPIVHIALRDKSRNQVESLLYQLAALEINNVLVLTGDYPSIAGFEGKSSPVFDLDSVNGLRLISEMNRGMEHEIMGKRGRLSPTHFFAGVAFSPFKQMEAEMMGQYYKLKKKVEAGADFIITQVGYDVRKLHELKLWLESNRYNIPVVMNIYVLSLQAARAMRNNRVPGCVVTDDLLARIEKESKGPDKGRSARLERAAKMFAIAKGLGFRGAYISGQGLPYESVEYIISRGQELTPGWRDFIPEFDYPQENGFYFFKKDATTGLNLEISAPRLQKPARPLIYLFSLAVHKSLFEPKSPLFKLMRALARFVDSADLLRKLLASLEFWTKAILYGCQDCGDCALFDVAYLCPVSQCPKDQRNAPCGGSFQGWCEVYPYEKQCIWVRAYQRLKTQHREGSIGEIIVPPRDWGLQQTSSWLNYFLGRDHVSKRAGIAGFPSPRRTGIEE
jgi:methylenetetrahydrofolate reductase (NADH)